MKLIRFALWLMLTIVGAAYTLLIVMPITVVAAIVYYRTNPDEAHKAAEHVEEGGKSKFTEMISMVFGVDVIDDILDKLNWWSEKSDKVNKEG